MQRPRSSSRAPPTATTTRSRSGWGSTPAPVRASQGGHVVSVAPDKVVIRQDDGTDDEIELDNNLPNNRKTYFHQTPTVQAGQRVEAGHLLARSNFTDGEGTLALGKNSRVVYAPYDGKTYEDAWVISRSYADKMKSQHAYQHTLEPDDGTEIGVKAHLAAFPGVFSRKQLETFDDQGIKKPGSVVEYGDPLVVAVGKRPQTQDRLHGGGHTAVAPIGDLGAPRPRARDRRGPHPRRGRQRRRLHRTPISNRR